MQGEVGIFPKVFYVNAGMRICNYAGLSYNEGNKEGTIRMLEIKWTKLMKKDLKKYKHQKDVISDLQERPYSKIGLRSSIAIGLKK